MARGPLLWPAPCSAGGALWRRGSSLTFMALWSLSAKYSAVLLMHFTAGKLRCEGCQHPASPVPPVPPTSEHPHPMGTTPSIPTRPEGVSLSSLIPGAATALTLLALVLSPRTPGRPVVCFCRIPVRGWLTHGQHQLLEVTRELSPDAPLNWLPSNLQIFIKDCGMRARRCLEKLPTYLQAHPELAGDAHPGGDAACSSGQGCR